MDHLGRAKPPLRSGQHYTVLELEPLGHAYSDRPEGYPFPIHDQVHAVADQEGVGEFVVWGYSLGGPMALATAKESARVTAVVAGGYSPLDAPSETALRRSTHSVSREFMRWYRSFEPTDLGQTP